MRLKRGVALALVFLLLLAVPDSLVLAMDRSQSFELELTGNARGTLAAGNILTVTCTLRRTDQTESWDMYAWQTEIAYDNSAFELIEGSVSPAEGVGSSVHTGSLENRVYFNDYSISSSGEKYPAELRTGSFQLRVKQDMDSGTYTIRNTHYLVGTKAGKDTYEIISKDLNVSVSADGTPVTPGNPAGNDSTAVKMFRDVLPGAWYEKAVSFVASHGLFNGTGDDLFSPEDNMTRAMLVTVLWRLEGSPVVSAENTFADVETDTWYTEAVTWAAANGIVLGYDSTTFGPKDNITREQMATILYRYAKSRGYADAGLSDLTAYTDRGEISEWAMDAMQWANATGLITGRTEHTLVPQGLASRAEVATIFMRFCKNIIMEG